jgi:hypothetical protein
VGVGALRCGRRRVDARTRNCEPLATFPEGEVKLAAILLVSIGGAGLIVSFVLMRRKLEQLRRWREERD